MPCSNFPEKLLKFCRGCLQSVGQQTSTTNSHSAQLTPQCTFNLDGNMSNLFIGDSCCCLLHNATSVLTYPSVVGKFATNARLMSVQPGRHIVESQCGKFGRAGTGWFLRKIVGGYDLRKWLDRLLGWVLNAICSFLRRMTFAFANKDWLCICSARVFARTNLLSIRQNGNPGESSLLFIVCFWEGRRWKTARSNDFL